MNGALNARHGTRRCRQIARVLPCKKSTSTVAARVRDVVRPARIVDFDHTVHNSLANLGPSAMASAAALGRRVPVLDRHVLLPPT